MTLAVSIPCFNASASEKVEANNNKYTINNNITTSDSVKLENNQKLSDAQNLQDALIELKEGETIEVPLQIKELNNNGQTQATTYGTVVDLGNAGTVTFTRRSDKIEYSMNITKSYTSVKATAEILDVYSGLVQSTYPVIAAYGSVPYKAIATHQFSLSINGYAYFYGTPVVSIYAEVHWVN